MRRTKPIPGDRRKRSGFLVWPMTLWRENEKGVRPIKEMRVFEYATWEELYRGRWEPVQWVDDE